eukprot:GHVN01059555.1.p1 GENE.GHVN01059555.1~~GHVN01059555.1.p1  ORF type:complete len:297 (+),score=7.15 GHVN01059555.1:254-1144(+)
MEALLMAVVGTTCITFSIFSVLSGGLLSLSQHLICSLVIGVTLTACGVEGLKLMKAPFRVMYLWMSIMGTAIVLQFIHPIYDLSSGPAEPPLCQLMTLRRWTISLYWVVIILGGVYVLARMVLDSRDSLFSVRKGFHLMGMLVFVPLIAMGDLEFLSVAFTLAFCVAVGLEVLRCLGDQVFSPTLGVWFDRFLDERDARGMVTTHLHLMLGFGAPVLLSFYARGLKKDSFAPWIGVVTVGVGDTAAALFGKKFGIHKLPFVKNGKSWEGLIAFIVFASLGAELLVSLPALVRKNHV